MRWRCLSKSEGSSLLLLNRKICDQEGYRPIHQQHSSARLSQVDRPYGPILNLLHHGIGSTHVCHHVNSSIPHYNAWRGTQLLRQRFPELVRYDSTPIHKALWRIATRCGGAVYQNPSDRAFYY